MFLEILFETEVFTLLLNCFEQENKSSQVRLNSEWGTDVG